ncbi:MAG: SDR family oxidoreductase [Pyrinomonadaceae bacterium]
MYDLAVERELAMRVNIEGTRRVNEFAKTLAQLKRYHYVSTCYVAGKRTGHILESELRHKEGFRNYYEETKYLAELEVEALKSELPVTIHRPSVVCGDSRTGETVKYDGIYYLIHYLRSWPQLLTHINIGNRDVHLNVVPVDFVIEAITALAENPASVGATVQLADPAPLTTHELFEAIAIGLAGHGSHVTVPAQLVHNSLLLPIAPRLTGLPRVAVPYFFSAKPTIHAKPNACCHRIKCTVRIFATTLEISSHSWCGRKLQGSEAVEASRLNSLLSCPVKEFLNFCRTSLKKGD